MLELAGRDDLSLSDDDSEPPNAAFRVPDLEAGGGWVAVLYTQAVAPPASPAPGATTAAVGLAPSRFSGSTDTASGVTASTT